MGDSLRGHFTEEMAFAKSLRVAAFGASSRVLRKLLPEEAEAGSREGAGRERGSIGWGNTSKNLLIILCMPINENV